MPTIAAQLENAFQKAITDAFGESPGLASGALISVSQNEKFGDYQSNAAMGLAKQLSDKTNQKTNPRAVAEQIKARLSLGDMAEEVSIAGPGFINVRLSPKWVAERLERIEPDERLGIEPTGKPETVVVDYSGPNVAKEMHVGHLRSTIIGDAISRILEFEGDRVIRQNHIGDWGTQFGMLIAHLQLGLHLSGSGPAPGGIAYPTGNPFDAPEITDLEGFYHASKLAFDEDPAFADEARKAVVRLQGGASEERRAWQRIVEATRKHYQPLYERLGVKLKPEHEMGESAYNALLPGVVKDLREKRLAIASEGATAVFIDGPEKSPLIIEKTGGGFLYGTTDLAAIRFRVNDLHANRIIYTHDSRQAQHFDQVFRTAQKAGWADDVSLEYAPFGTMLGEDGRPFKSRSGDTVKLKDLLDEAVARARKLVDQKVAERSAKEPAFDLPEPQRQRIAEAVGIGAVKYADLSKDRVSDYLFSFDKMLAMDGNTAPYLQYAHARICSIFRRAGAERASVRNAKIILDSPYELSLAKHIVRLGEVLEVVARELKPHHLATYLYELATKFSSFYENCPVIQSEEPTRTSRLALADLTARTLALGLDLLGIEHPEQM